MSITKSVMLVALILVSMSCGFFIGENNKLNANIKAESRFDTDTNISNLIKILSKSQIESISVSESENDAGKITASVKYKLDEPCKTGDVLKTCEEFAVYDESGRAIFEYKDFRITSATYSRLINSNSLQMILVTNGGGTDDFLQVFDNKNNKFSEIEVPTPDAMQIRGGWFTIPQYQTGIEHPYFKPSELIAIQQIGGGDSDATASVLRFQNGKFQKVGEFSMQKLGDFIEQQIIANR